MKLEFWIYECFTVGTHVLDNYRFLMWQIYYSFSYIFSLLLSIKIYSYAKKIWVQNQPYYTTLRNTDKDSSLLAYDTMSTAKEWVTFQVIQEACILGLPTTCRWSQHAHPNSSIWHYHYHFAVCLSTGPCLLPKQVLCRVRTSALSFSFQYSLQ
jgi:hypothetical protein